MHALQEGKMCFNARLGKTPYEALTGSKPNLSKMHIFGCTCYACTQNAKKLDPRSKKGIFVGYDKRSPAYLVYFPDTDKIERVRCVKFFKEGNLQPIIDLDVHEGEPIPCETHVPIVSRGASSDEGGGVQVALTWEMIPHTSLQDTLFEHVLCQSI